MLILKGTANLLLMNYVNKYAKIGQSITLSVFKLLLSLSINHPIVYTLYSLLYIQLAYKCKSLYRNKE